MQTIHSPQEMQTLALRWRAEGKKIAFVPTMGALHEGHLSLMREGKKRGDFLVVSVFVNPLQFGPKEDFNKYPRNIEADTEKMRPIGVDAVFFPTTETMYPKGYQTRVEVTGVTKGLCGASRPAFFEGVTTVVQKLFNIVGPQIALFGEKDYQQLLTIKRMVADLNMPIEIIGMPIVREADGLAMSSRNIYLSSEEREAALSLPRSLKLAQKMASSGERNAPKIIDAVKRHLEESGGLRFSGGNKSGLKSGIPNKVLRIDYVKICNSETLEELNTLAPHPFPSPLWGEGVGEGGHTRLLIALFVGKTRLIDNCGLL